MALIPRIDVVQTACNKIKLVEQTNPYSSTTNGGGWGGPNLNTYGITSSIVNIFPESTSSSPSAISTSGTITGTLFTDTTHGSGIFQVGQLLTGTGVTPGTTIVGVITGTGTNNGGTYIVSISQTVIATTINGYTIADSIILADGTIDLYSGATGEPTPPAFTILDNIAWSNPDGVYKIVYSVTGYVGEALSTYTNPTQYTLFLCNLCACKDELVQKLVESCSSENTTKLKEQVDQMEIFIYGIQSAFSCNDFTTVENLLANATTYCQTLSNCNCGCSGC
jgi:hypothetical protein